MPANLFDPRHYREKTYLVPRREPSGIALKLELIVGGDQEGYEAVFTGKYAA